MRGDLIVGIFVVVEAVWILSSLFRNREDGRGKGRPGRPADAPPVRTRPPGSARERPDFLEEFNRRRLEAARPRPPAPRGTPAAPAGQRRSQDAERRTRAAETAARPRRTPTAGTANDAIETVPARPIAVAKNSRRVGTIEMQVAAEDVQTPPVLTSLVSASGRLAQATREALLPLLRSRTALPTAVLLHEVFGQPLCRRPMRGRPHGGRGPRRQPEG